MTQIDLALAAARPDLIATFERIARSRFDDMVKRHGPTLNENGSVHNSPEFSRTFYATISRCTKKAPGSKPWLMDGAYTICEASLAILAGAWADETIAACRDKLHAKLGDLNDAKVLGLGSLAFDISGTRGGRAVFISQRMIHNVSTKGTVFAQFPARITLDGKATSEVAYKKAFA